MRVGGPPNPRHNLLPGPASTQLAIFCAWRLRRRPGTLADGIAFIVPGLVVILALAALFLSKSPPLWVLGAGAGAGAAVPAVAIHAAARALSHSRQYAVLAGALVVLFLLRRRVVVTLLAAAAAGVIIALTAGLAPHG